MSFLENIRNREVARSAFGYGVTTADQYLKHIQACAGEGICRSSNPWSGVADAPGWDTVVKEAAGKLVYSNEDTVVKSETVVTNSSDFRKALDNEETEVPPRTIMVFQNIVTTPRKDRDGDVLRTDGAEIDSKMPLLWQHMHVAPIGRMLEVVDHSHDQLKVTSAVIDSALGNDTANLIEFGALRISHGFIPLEFQELDVKDGEVPGFDITRFEIMEESVVSVPSNTDAIIEAVSRGKLADPLVKGWAQHYFDNRPVPVSGVDSSAWSQVDTLTVDLAKAPETAPEESAEEADKVAENEAGVTEEANAVAEDADNAGKAETGCTCGPDKSVELPFPPFANEHSCSLSDPENFDEFRRDEKESNGKVFSVIYGHDPETDMWQAQAYRYLREDWTEAEAKEHCDDNGGLMFEPAIGGEESVVVAAKGGRVLSARNTKNIETAVELITDIAEAKPENVSTSYRALAREAVRSLGDVLKEATPADEDEKETLQGDDCVESIAKELLIKADDADSGLLRRVALVLSETADAKDRQREAAEFQAIISNVI